MKKIKPITTFVIICFFVGLVACIYNYEIFTSASLIETILIVCAAVYIFFRYQVSLIIRKYQDADFIPAKSTRLFHDYFATLSTQVIIPICRDFLYAAFFLFIVKNLDFVNLNKTADFIYSLYEFKKDFLKSPLKYLLIILTVLTLLRYLSHNKLKAYKKFIKFVTFPMGVAATLLFFMHTDTGLQTNILTWELGKKPAEGKNLTFNAGKTEEKKVEEIVDAYVDLIVDNLSQNNTNNLTADDKINFSSDTFYYAVHHVASLEKINPFVTKEIMQGHAGSESKYLLSEKADIRKMIATYNPATSSNTRFRATGFYEAAYNPRTERQTSLQDFLDLLNEERESIHIKPEDETGYLVKDLLKTWLGETFLFKDFPEKINTYDFITDAAFDLLKDKTAEGLYSLFLKKIVTGNDIRNAVSLVKQKCSTAFNTFYIKLQDSKNLLVSYYNKIVHGLKLESAEMDALQNRLSSKAILDYLRDFPESPLNEQLRQALPLVEFREGQKDRLLDADLEYWNSFDWNKQHLEAFEEIHSNLNRLQHEQEFQFDYRNAKTENTSEAWDDLIKKYPANPQKNEFVWARDWQRKMEKSQKEKPVATIKDAEFDYTKWQQKQYWENYMTYHPSSPYANEIKELLAKENFSALDNLKTEITFSTELKPYKFHPVEAPKSFWEEAFEFLKYIRE